MKTMLKKQVLYWQKAIAHTFLIMQQEGVFEH